MKRLIAVLAAGVLVAGVVAAQLWLKLRAERQQTTELAGQQRPGGTSARAAAMNDPHVQEFARQMMGSRASQLYPDLAEALNLTAAEARQILDLLEKFHGDLGVLSMARPGGAATQEIQGRLQEQLRAQEAELKAALGSRYPQWQEYKLTAETRQRVNALNQTLIAGGKPLSEAQSKALVTALVAETSRSLEQEHEQARARAALGTAGTAYTTQQSEQWAADLQQRLVDVTSAHLDAEQRALYKRQVERGKNMTRAISGTADRQADAP